MDSLDNTPALTDPGNANEHKFERQSNIELLRIVATFFILVLHANFQAFGAPSKSEIMDAPAASFLRFLVQAIAVVGVDVFVLISGWFGIRPSWKSALNLAFQFFFFTVGIYAVAVGFGTLKFSKEIILNCFCLGHWNWFLRAYVGLMILSPILNAYADNTPRKPFALLLTAFFAFEIIYGWMARETQGFYKGQSVISFIGLYLLARFMRRFRPRWTERTMFHDFCAYGCIALLIAVGALSSRLAGWKDGVHTLYSNASPFTIAASAFLLLAFSKLAFAPTKGINRIAKSAYASYLLHTHPAILAPVFIATIQSFPLRHSMPSFLAIFGFVLAVYAIAILIDQARIQCWNGIVRHALPWLDRPKRPNE